jgi:hypothetical protein
MKKAEFIELADALENIGYEIDEYHIVDPGVSVLGREKRIKKLVIAIQKAEAPEASASE